MLVLGIVKEIHDYDLEVSLPNGMTGLLPITNISPQYTQLLQSLTEGDTSIAQVRVLLLSCWGGFLYCGNPDRVSFPSI